MHRSVNRIIHARIKCSSKCSERTNRGEHGLDTTVTQEEDMSESGIFAYDSRRGSASKVCGLPGAAIVVLYFLGFGATDAASQQILRNTFTGSASCLDIINDGQNDKLKLAPCGNFTGQHWFVARRSDGTFQLQTEFTGPGRCLDIINDGQNNRL